jgi:hypothetical protein
MGIASCTCATAWLWTAPQFINMRGFWRGLVRTVFWSYERGSWPYDLMVVAIVAFVLLTPRSWFHDQPRSSGLINSGVQLVSQDSGSHTRTYRIDAKVLAPEKRGTKLTPELERETHDILDRTVSELQEHAFQVVQIDPVSGGDGSVLYYDVTVHL